MKYVLSLLVSCLLHTLVLAQSLDWKVRFNYPGSFPNTYYSFVDETGNLKISLYEAGNQDSAVFFEVNRHGSFCFDTLSVNSGEFSLIKSFSKYHKDTSFFAVNYFDSNSTYLRTSLLKVREDCFWDSSEYVFNCIQTCFLNNNSISCFCNDTIYVYRRFDFQLVLKYAPISHSNKTFVNEKFIETADHIFFFRENLQGNQSQVVVLNTLNNQMVVDTLHQGVGGILDFESHGNEIYFTTQDQLLKMDSMGTLKLLSTNENVEFKGVEALGNFVYTLIDSNIKPFEKRVFLEQRDLNGNQNLVFYPDSNARLGSSLYKTKSGELCYHSLM